MATVSINASARNDFGKSAARKIRFAGQLPGVVYSAGSEATHIALDPHELENAFRKTNNRNTLVELSVDGDTKTCLVRETQRDPVSARLIHIDFYEVTEGVDVNVQVPVRPVGTARGMTIGGVLRTIRRTLNVRCKPADIPSGIEIDITKLNIDDYVKVSAVAAPAGVEIVFAEDFNVLAIVGRRVAVETAVVDDDDAEAEDSGGSGDSEEAGE